MIFYVLKMKDTFLLFVILTSAVNFVNDKTSNSLLLVFVVSRNGHRTPKLEEIYSKASEKDLKKLYPGGFATLTKRGREASYQLGLKLRKRYNDFLGATYTPMILYSRTTEYIRTQTTLQLIHFGLFPPKHHQEWHPSINWQPIPYDMHKINKDKMLLGIYCPQFKSLFKMFKTTSSYQKIYRHHKSTFDNIQKEISKNLTSIRDFTYVIEGMNARKALGETMPSWYNKLDPEEVLNITQQDYQLSCDTLNLKQLNSGYLWKFILEEMQAKLCGIIYPPERKIYIISGHGFNLAFLMISMDIYYGLRPPPFASYLIFELHIINNVPGVKIFYNDYTSGSEPRQMRLPNCSLLCPFDRFYEIMSIYVPPDDFCFR